MFWVLIMLVVLSFLNMVLYPPPPPPPPNCRTQSGGLGGGPNTGMGGHCLSEATCVRSSPIVD